MINDKFLIKKKISQGSFGVVYVGQDVQTNQYVAIKIEKNDQGSSLEKEAKILQHLNGTLNIPRLFYFGEHKKQMLMVISFLGKDLTYYIRQYKKFSLKCVLLIAEQMLSILENIHLKSVLHRDIKPENILAGRDNDSNLYLVDFGISKFYRDKRGRHINFSENKPFLGTSRYASLGAHKGQEQSRRDDLESLGYVLVYLLKGSLPWQVLKLQDEQKIKAVGDMKDTMTLHELCNGLPNEFERMIDYARKLDFKAAPDYKFLKKMFQHLAHSQNIQDQLRYDWDFTPSSLQVPSSEIAVLKRSKRTVEQDQQEQLQMRKKQASSSTFNGLDGLSGNSFLKTPEQHCRKISLTPAKQKSNSSFNDSFSSCNQSGNQSVIGMPSYQNNLSQLSFDDHNLLALAFESMSKVTKEQLNQEEHEENNGDFSPSPLEVKYLKLKKSSINVHFKRTLLQIESMNILPPQSSFNQYQ
ncbi:unnamed protein product (macronuclear) [Paramecium tetraurelia]|uniref:Casein kinase I n=1 Tax=Paramecium tetraurelia TaxID=5888 RepID=A0C4A1_PARTE|nr:uncharacterized protein GSPATT00035098001 [Paramecium tetraurelia]CAK65618.1 unnamed protein product [Paramecium tetraurelia]|eukprot:XP_001433015.1 hypothetical protein (macronuclear) [Paramecium tetraurelia strain d4-2]